MRSKALLFEKGLKLSNWKLIKRSKRKSFCQKLFQTFRTSILNDSHKQAVPLTQQWKGTAGFVSSKVVENRGIANQNFDFVIPVLVNRRYGRGDGSMERRQASFRLHRVSRKFHLVPPRVWRAVKGDCKRKRMKDEPMKVEWKMWRD